MHMFDVDLPTGERARESEAYTPGERGGGRPDAARAVLGLTICYDVRFPYLYRALAKAGAEILTVPSAFTRSTGEAHWEILLRARAIETGAFVLAPAQGGRHEDGRGTWGRSMVVGPWGEIIAMADDDEPGVISRRCIDLAAAAKARAADPRARQRTRVQRTGAMIQYALVCDHDHPFEGWFAASDDYRRPGRARPGRLPALRRERRAQTDHGAGRRRHEGARLDRRADGRRCAR